MITFARRRRRLPLWRFVALRVCETALYVLYIAIFLQLAVPVAVSMARSIEAREERDCRLAFAKIGDYPALADVCKDAKARRAILMWDAIDGAARRAE